MGDSCDAIPADMASTLRETTNGGAPAGPPRDEAKAQLAREKGWVEQQPFKYDAAIPPPDAPSDINLPSGDEIPGWMHRARKYEWSDEYGDIGPEVPELEKELFGSELKLKKGYNFKEYVMHHFFKCSLLTNCSLLSIKVVAEATERPAPVRLFDNAGLHPIMLSNIKKSGYDIPTPVQAYTIPAVLRGRDVIAVAQTGKRKSQISRSIQ